MKRGKHPKSLANLRPPIRTGEVRNPTGINRKRPITDHYWETSEEPMPLALIRRFNRKWKARLLEPGDTWARGVAMRAFCESVMAGEVRAMKEIREAIEGKAPQRLEITGPQRREITIVIKNDRQLQHRPTPLAGLVANPGPMPPRPS